jgi:hypothetical protein
MTKISYQGVQYLMLALCLVTDDQGLRVCSKIKEIKLPRWMYQPPNGDSDKNFVSESFSIEFHDEEKVVIIGNFGIKVTMEIGNDG